MEKINIAIVEDGNLFRQSLALLISMIKEFELVTEAENGNIFLEQLTTLEKPVHIALVDMDMPGLNGMALNSVLRQQHPEVKVIILSIHLEEQLIAQMIDAGVAAYLAKNCDKEELITCIKTVYKTGFYINQYTYDSIKHIANHKNHLQRSMFGIPVRLTPREKEILNLICREYSNAEIAEELFLSQRTIEGHRNNLLMKIGCRNTAGLVLFAVKYGIYNFQN